MHAAPPHHAVLRIEQVNGSARPEPLEIHMFPVLQGNTFEQGSAAVGSLKFEPGAGIRTDDNGPPGFPVP